jgi:hypothetical protein
MLNGASFMRTIFGIIAALTVLQGLANWPAFGVSRLVTMVGSALEDPLVETAPTSRDEDDGLFPAIQGYRGQTSPDDFGVLGPFAIESQTTFLLGGPR